MNKLLALMVMLLFSGGMAGAEEDTFDPTNPPEPTPTYKVTVVAEPAGAAYVSGNGRYTKGQGVWLNTSSADSDYSFVHWTLNGEVYSTSRSVYLNMPEEDLTFVAVYEYVVFDPTNPADPGANYSQRVYLQCDPAEAGSFNLGSGAKHTQDSQIWVQTYASQGFKFDGWYDGDTKISDDKGFYYTVPTTASTLVARFHFDPDSPADPVGSGTDIDNPTDVTVVRVDGAESSPMLYDMQGRRVIEGAVPPGLYIRRTATSTQKILIQ